MSATKDRFRQATRTVETVAVNGHDFHIRALTLRELGDLDTYAEGGEEEERGYRYAVGLFAAAVCEADGKTVYKGPGDPDIEDVPGDYFRAINRAAMKLNGMAKDDDKGNG